MIYLHTGQPGAGKTLFTVWETKKWADKENRPVYYNGIPECRVPGWIELDDPTKWHECPAGSIIILDEAQRVFRTRGTGAAVPEHVAKLETHRHQGLDIVIITQHPMLIDSNVRRLAGLHRHVMRSWGAKYAVVHEWQQVKEQCDKNRADSIKKQFAYPKEAFELYKSAEVHTHKMRLPWRLAILVVGPIMVAALAYYAYLWFHNSAQKGKPSEAVQGDPNVKPLQVAPPPGSKEDKDRYVAQYQPRLAGYVHTAPVYDQLTQPVRVPVPAGCIASKSRCSCYTQDATPYAIDDAECRHVAAHGLFLAFDPAGKQDKRQVEHQGMQRLMQQASDQRQHTVTGLRNDPYVGVKDSGPVMAFDRQFESQGPAKVASAQ